MLILISILFFGLYFWSFGALGRIICYGLKIRIRSYAGKFMIGFFAYFFGISIFMIPVEFISSIKYIFLIYYFISLNIVFCISLLLLIKYWLTFNINIKYCIYFTLALACFISIYYANQHFQIINTATSKAFSFFDTTAIKFDKGKYEISGSLLNSDIYLSTNTWITTMGMWLLFIQPSSLSEIHNLLALLDCMFYASLYIFIIKNFQKENYKSIFNNILLLLVLLIAKISFYYFGYNSYCNETIFEDLLIFIILLTVIHFKNNYHMSHLPSIIGFATSSYTAFDFRSSYIIIFITYSILWVMVYYNYNNFLRDWLKCSTWPLIVFMVSSLISANYLFFIINMVIILFMIIIFYNLHWRQDKIYKLQEFIYDNRKLLILFLPFMFITAGVLVLLFKDTWNFNFWNLKIIAPLFYSKLHIFVSDRILNTLNIIFTVLILACSVFWIIFRKFNIRKEILALFDNVSIVVITFFNPVSIQIILNYMQGGSFDNCMNLILISLYLGISFICLNMFRPTKIESRLNTNWNLWYSNKIKIKQNKIRLKQIKRYYTQTEKEVTKNHGQKNQ